ncbi:methyltransferase domain-containing protein [Erythrobacter sp. LQ02-29]|uniref:class I SAM-dependent methyltransferase n=1 Tax=Erythrobacter sp. LQ02-29 TaxID=2920384 RepID=UPI001F4EB1B6|nr:methyltransferase domain-containing protein [Erythrobacter sp. LQ02-29]MCP9223347.1 methyltransferase domain-containing protein [Erythrobacter sp. LQ02-29]
MVVRTALLSSIGVLAACGASNADSHNTKRSPFPDPDRPVSALGSNQFSTEVKRDSVNEAQKVMDLAGIENGMTVADIGAGEGYYTVRLAERVGQGGRVLAQDIDRDALDRLGKRIERERLDNVSIKQGQPSDPRLPEGSFDRVFMIHMYHEIAQPYAFLWRMWPSLKEGGQVIVVDVDRPADQHGIAPLLLACEFGQAGYQLDAFRDAPEISGYYAQFRRAARRPRPQDIEPCRGGLAAGSTDAAS